MARRLRGFGGEYHVSSIFGNITMGTYLWEFKAITSFCTFIHIILHLHNYLENFPFGWRKSPKKFGTNGKSIITPEQSIEFDEKYSELVRWFR
jgi:hypothetical protein